MVILGAAVEPAWVKSMAGSGEPWLPRVRSWSKSRLWPRGRSASRSRTGRWGRSNERP